MAHSPPMMHIAKGGKMSVCTARIMIMIDILTGKSIRHISKGGRKKDGPKRDGKRNGRKKPQRDGEPMTG